MNQQRNKKKSGFPWGVLVIFIPFLARAFSNGEIPLPALAGVVLVIVGIAIVIRLAGKKPQSAKAAPDRALHRPDPRTRSFTAPDPYCITCENTGEDHFVHDRQQRIAQLDEWLKNGIVDKNEYRVLKQRFERDQ